MTSLQEKTGDNIAYPHKDSNIQVPEIFLPKDHDYSINTDHEESSSDQDDSKSVTTSIGSSIYGALDLSDVSGTNSEKKRSIRKLLSAMKVKIKAMRRNSNNDTSDRSNFLTEEIKDEDLQLDRNSLKSSTPIQFPTGDFPYLDILREDSRLENSIIDNKYQKMFPKYDRENKWLDSLSTHASFNMEDDHSVVNNKENNLDESPLTPEEYEIEGKVSTNLRDMNILQSNDKEKICDRIQSICQKLGIENASSQTSKITKIEINANTSILLDKILLKLDNNLENLSSLRNDVYKRKIEKEEIAEKLRKVEKELIVKQEGMKTELHNKEKIYEKYKSQMDQINVLFELTESSSKKDLSETEKMNALFNVVETHSMLKTKVTSLYNENTNLKDMCRTLKMETQNAKDELEDKTYDAIKSQFQKVVLKLEQCIEEHKERGELQQERIMGTVQMYNEEREKVIGLRKEKKILGSQIQLLDCQKNESLQFMSQFMNSFSNYVDKKILFDYNILLESLTSKLNIEFLSGFTDFQTSNHFEKIEAQLNEFYQEIATNKFMDQLISQFVQTIGTNNILNSQLDNLENKYGEQVEYINELTHYIKKLKRRKTQQKNSHSLHHKTDIDQKIKED